MLTSTLLLNRSLVCSFNHHPLHLLLPDLPDTLTLTLCPPRGICAVAVSGMQCTMVLQKEANDLSSRAEAEMANVMDELTRVHSLVASFQDQIREVGGLTALELMHANRQ